LIFDAINDLNHFFVIPMAAIASRRTIEIPNYHVEAYKGQWVAYLERWDILMQLVGDRPLQLRMGTA
jgi:hypothetical protein